MTHTANRHCLYCGTPLADGSLRCRSCGEVTLPWDEPRNAPWWERLFHRSRRGRFRYIATKRIVPNPFQPREDLDIGSPEFERLEASVRHFGVIVPLLVRRVSRRTWQLVAGQRRLEAARRAGVPRVPAVEFALSDRELQEVAYLENMHRRNLNALDDIRAFLRLVETDPDRNWQSLAARLGCDLREIRARRRLMDLPVLLQEAVARGVLAPEQAEAVAEASAQFTLESVLRLAAERGLSAREIRALVEQEQNNGSAARPVL